MYLAPDSKWRTKCASGNNFILLSVGRPTSPSTWNAAFIFNVLSKASFPLKGFRETRTGIWSQSTPFRDILSAESMVRTVLPIEDHPHVGTPIKMVLFYLLLRPFSLFCFFVFCCPEESGFILYPPLRGGFISRAAILFPPRSGRGRNCGPQSGLRE